MFLFNLHTCICLYIFCIICTDTRYIHDGVLNYSWVYLIRIIYIYIPIIQQEEVERANNRLRSYIQLFAKSQCNFCDFLSVDNEDIERLFSLAKFLTSRESDSPGPCNYSRVMMVHKLFSFKVNKQWKVIKTITTSTLDISKFEQYLKLHHPEECLEILHKT